MAAEHEEVFRSMVDGVIQRQVEANQTRHRSWPDHDKYAEVAGLVFASLNPHDAHRTPFPISRTKEHLWGVSPDQRLRVDQFRGLLGIISYGDKPGLYRNWAIQTAPQSWPSTERLLTAEETEGIVEWARSPHLNPDALTAAMTLTEEEHTKMTAIAKKDAHDSAELRESLRRLDEAHRLPPDAGNIIIG